MGRINVKRNIPVGFMLSCTSDMNYSSLSIIIKIISISIHCTENTSFTTVGTSLTAESNYRSEKMKNTSKIIGLKK